MPPAALTIEELFVSYGHSAPSNAVDGVSLVIERGQTVGLVGESGSGKSTIAKAIVGLVQPQNGSIRVGGVDARERRRKGSPAVQLVFQNPHASLNPRMTVGRALREAAECRRDGTGARQIRVEVDNLLDLVGLSSNALERYPHQFSGGQLQRIAIARALATKPEVLVLDEITASLDVSVQARTLNLIRELQAELGLSLLYISHDLSIVRYLSDAVAVMYLGRLVETAPTDPFFAAPRHPYSRALIAAIPKLRGEGHDWRIGLLEGEVTDVSGPIVGCRFRERCPLRRTLVASDAEVCARADPPLRPVEASSVACHYADRPSPRESEDRAERRERIALRH